MNKMIIPGSVKAALPCAKKAKNIRKAVQGQEYHYTQYLPSGMKDGLPLVVELHGGGGTGEIQCACTAWAELAERENFVVIYPAAREMSHVMGIRTWRCQDGDYEKDADYIMEIIDLVSDQYRIDRSRIYVSGMSLGDMMGVIFAAKYGRLMAGLCSFNGPTNPKEWQEKIRLSAEVPVIQIRGELDVTLPVPGGCKPAQEEALIKKRKYLSWNREQWMEKNKTVRIPRIQLEEKLNYALYQGETCDVRYVECKAMGHVEPLYGMEMAWKYCFSRYRRTEYGIERILPPDDIETEPGSFALAAGCKKAYTAAGIKELPIAPVIGEPEPIPENHWCTVCREDYSRKSVLYAPLDMLALLLGGKTQNTDEGQNVIVTTGTYSFYTNTCFAASSKQHFAMEKPAMEIEDKLWVPVQEALFVMGYKSVETDGVVFCTSRPAYLSGGFAALLQEMLT